MNIYNELLALCKKSLNSNDVPIGALIVKDNVIIGKGYNTREKNQDILGHAEINAIREAQNYLNNWNLQGCVLYVTLKPCSMCREIIKQARIDKVYYILEKLENKKEYDRTEFIKNNDYLEEDYLKILSEFFQNLREKKE